ncbi:MAG: hypothetical protein QM764_17900 [Chitinophagaceae bacterium]
MYVRTNSCDGRHACYDGNGGGGDDASDGVLPDGIFFHYGNLVDDLYGSVSFQDDSYDHRDKLLRFYDYESFRQRPAAQTLLLKKE